MPDISILVQIDSKTAEASIKRLDQGLEDLSGTSGKAESKLSGLWKQFALGDLAADAIRKTLSGTTGLIGSLISTASETENYRLRLETLLGSQDAANKAFEFFKETASELPFTLQDVVESGVKISTVTDEFEKWLVPVADVAAAMGMELPEAADQMVRAFSSGLGAADMFRERGVSQLIKEYAKLKYSIDDISKVSLPMQRKIMYEAFTDIEYKFSGATDKLKNSWSGMMSMLEDAWFNFKNAVMEAGVFDMLKEGFRDVLDWINRMKEEGKLQEWAEDIADLLKDVIGTFELFGKAIITVYKGLKLLDDLRPGDKVSRVTKKYTELTEVIGFWSTFAESAAAKHIKSVEEMYEIWDKYEQNTQETYAAIATGKEGKALQDFILKLGGSHAQALKGAADHEEALKNLETQAYDTSEGLNALNEKAEDFAVTIKFVKTSLHPFLSHLIDIKQASQKAQPSLKKFFETAIEGPRDMTGVLENALPVMESYVFEYQQTWEETLQQIMQENYQMFETIYMYAGYFISQIGAITGQYYQNEMIQIKNLEKKQTEGIEAWYAEQKEYIEKSITDEEEKKLALEALEEEYNARMDELSATVEEKAESAKRTAAKHDKAVALMAAIVNTAQAVTRTLASVPFPFNVPLAAAVAALGAIQIGAIKAQPIPLAKGAIFERPTYLVGEAGPEALIGVTPLVTEIRRVIHEEVYRSSGSKALIVNVYIGNEKLKSFTVKTVEKEADLGKLHLPPKAIRAK